MCVTVFPFVHNFTFGIEGVFGFTYMSSFLYALSMPVGFLACGLLLKMSHSLVYLPVLFTGFFYGVYVFVPYSDFPLWLYVVVGFMVSAMGCVIAIKLHQVMLFSEKKLKTAIQLLINFCINQRFKAKDLREYEIDFEEVMYKVDDVTD